MAERRFISKQIFTDDEFTDLEVQTRLLYVYLILNADDDGMLKNAKQMMFLAGADKNDLQTLVDAGYLYDFSSGVYVIRHWNMMNKVQPSRKADTIYQKEKSELHIVNDVYCRQDVDKVSTQDSTGKDSIGKNKDDLSITDRLTENEIKLLKDSCTDFDQLIRYADAKIFSRENSSPISDPYSYLKAIIINDGFLKNS